LRPKRFAIRRRRKPLQRRHSRIVGRRGSSHALVVEAERHPHMALDARSRDVVATELHERVWRYCFSVDHLLYTPQAPRSGRCNRSLEQFRDPEIGGGGCHG